MTVNPGFGGQSFVEAMVAKTRRRREMIGKRPVQIEIDGGVTPATAPLVAQVGLEPVGANHRLGT